VKVVPTVKRQGSAPAAFRAVPGNTHLDLSEFLLDLFIFPGPKLHQLLCVVHIDAYRPSGRRPTDATRLGHAPLVDSTRGPDLWVPIGRASNATELLILSADLSRRNKYASLSCNLKYYCYTTRKNYIIPSSFWPSHLRQPATTKRTRGTLRWC